MTAAANFRFAPFTAMRSHGKRIVLLVLPFTWLILILPAALYSQWFTLDVGGIFSRAAIFPHNLDWALLPNSPYNIGGRYFPAYWLYHFALYRIFYTNLAAHFAVHDVLFIAALGMTCRLFYVCTRSIWWTCALGVLICLGGAVAENVYTLGKAEPLSYLLTATVLWIAHSLDLKQRLRSAVLLAAIAVMMLTAIWIKETSLSLIAFAPLALATRWLTSPGQGLRSILRVTPSKRDAVVFGALALAAVVSRIPKLGIWDTSVEVGSKITYLEYTIDAELIWDNLAFYVTQQPDVLFFGLVGLVLLAMLGARLRAGKIRDAQVSARDFEFAVALLLMAWSYYLILLVWRWPMGYYMLVPSIAFKFCAFYAVIAARRASLLRTRALTAIACGFGLCAAYGGLQYYYVATSQLTFSRIYTEAVSKYVALSKARERLIIESYPFYSEQVNNTRQVIFMMTGQSRMVSGIADLVNPAVNTPKLLKLLDISQKQLDTNELALPERDDFVLVMTGNKLATWFVRGVTPYYAEDSILRAYNAYDMIPVAERKIFVPTAFLDLWTNRLSFGPTYFGYKLYRVASERPRLVWRGRYPDGWTGKSASIKLYPEFGSKARITVSTPEFNTPNRVVVRQDDRVVQELTLHAGRERSFTVDVGRDVPTTIAFQVGRTVVPKALKMNKDEREIGVLIKAESLQ